VAAVGITAATTVILKSATKQIFNQIYSPWFNSF
jgi:hypothetical protein